MGPSLTSCTNVVLGEPGDHTAGLMYNTWVHPNSPVLGNTSLTNYPYGENLWQPLAFSSIVPSTAHWLFTKALGFICGWNLLILLSFMASALVMFGFIRWLTKNSWVAFFAAYAYAFSPYHSFASRGQVAGLLGTIFLLALWQFISIWQRPSWLKAISLGAIISFGFYTDGYFILIGLVMFLSLWVSGVSYALLTSRLAEIKKQLFSLALASLIAFFALLPLAWLNHHYAALINSIFSNARGNILVNAQVYSAQLKTYFIPKSLLFMGYAVLVLSALAVYLLAKEYRGADKKERATNQMFFVGWSAFVLTIFGAWFSLRPVGYIFGWQFHNPTYYILQVTTAWRVFGRVSALVSIGIVILGSIGLAKLLQLFPRWRNWIIGACLAVLIAELSILPPYKIWKFDSFNYNKAPAVYSWLKHNSSIKAIAEYPIAGLYQGKYAVSYFTYQEISGKPLFNSLLPDSPDEALRRSIAGINDPQTLPVLRALGVGLVNLRSFGAGDTLNMRQAGLNNNDLKLVFDYKPDSISSFIIRPGQTADYALVLESVDSMMALQPNGKISYTVGNDALLNLVKMPNGKSAAQLNVSFKLSADSNRPIEVTQNGQMLWFGIIGRAPQNINVQASPADPITVSAAKSEQPVMLTFTDLQALNP